jgi:hypothetical protein
MVKYLVRGKDARGPDLADRWPLLAPTGSGNDRGKPSEGGRRVGVLPGVSGVLPLEFLEAWLQRPQVGNSLAPRELLPWGPAPCGALSAWLTLAGSGFPGAQLCFTRQASIPYGARKSNFLDREKPDDLYPLFEFQGGAARWALPEFSRLARNVSRDLNGYIGYRSGPGPVDDAPCYLFFQLRATFRN